MTGYVPGTVSTPRKGQALLAVDVVSSLPCTGRLPDGDVEAVPNVDVGDRDEQGCECPLIVVLRGCLPDLVGYGVRPVADVRNRLGERQGSAFFIGEAGVIPPGGNSENAIVRFACLFQIAAMHVNADTTAIDMAGAQLNQLERPGGHSALLC